MTITTAATLPAANAQRCWTMASESTGRYRIDGSDGVVVRTWPIHARERAGRWSAASDPVGVPATSPDGTDRRSTRGATDGADGSTLNDHTTSHAELDHLDRSVAEVVGADLGSMQDEDLTRRLDRLRRPVARLSAERARLTAELERRRAAAIDDPADRARSQRDLRRQLADRANSTPSATKQDAEAGRIADEHRRTGASFADGAISAEHVRLIGDTLRALPPERREEAEAELIELARRTNPTVFGKHARELMVREAPTNADAAARREHLQRRVRSYDTPDGGFAFSGLLYGVMAETARAAMDAFRRPDTPGEHRSPEQRSADAFEQLCATALRTGEAPTRHGVRPHVIITMTADQLELGDHGIAHLGSGQPVTLRQLRTLLADCTWGRVLLGPDSTPIEASAAVRTVPAGLWRVLVARDGGCTWDGCDAPASWCDVAHGEVAFTDGGRLSPANAALLCRRHHRRFDLGGWRIRITGGAVTYTRDEDARGATATGPATAFESDPNDRSRRAASALDQRDPGHPSHRTTDKANDPPAHPPLDGSPPGDHSHDRSVAPEQQSGDRQSSGQQPALPIVGDGTRVPPAHADP